MITETKTFKRDYREIWSGGKLSRVKLYYSAVRDTCACIACGEDARFFMSVGDALSWAARNGWIKDSSVICDSVTDAIAAVEREADKYCDRMDAQFHRNQKLNAALSGGDYGSVMRMIKGRWGF